MYCLGNYFLLSPTSIEKMKRISRFLYLVVLIIPTFLISQLVIKNADFTKRQSSVYALTKNKVVQEKNWGITSH